MHSGNIRSHAHEVPARDREANHARTHCRRQRAQLFTVVRAVRVCVASEVVALAGDQTLQPDRWVALVLDGEIDGVPFTEAYRYGRDRLGDTRISDVPRTAEAIHEDHEAARGVKRRGAGATGADCDTTVEAGRFQGTVRHEEVGVSGELSVLGGAGLGGGRAIREGCPVPAGGEHHRSWTLPG